jgi:hypothetical protein
LQAIQQATTDLSKQRAVLSSTSASGSLSPSSSSKAVIGVTPRTPPTSHKRKKQTDEYTKPPSLKNSVPDSVKKVCNVLLTPPRHHGPSHVEAFGYDGTQLQRQLKSAQSDRDVQHPPVNNAQTLLEALSCHGKKVSALDACCMAVSTQPVLTTGSVTAGVHLSSGSRARTALDFNDSSVSLVTPDCTSTSDIEIVCAALNSGPDSHAEESIVVVEVRDYNSTWLPKNDAELAKKLEGTPYAILLGRVFLDPDDLCHAIEEINFEHTKNVCGAYQHIRHPMDAPKPGKHWLGHIFFTLYPSSSILPS